MSEIKEGDVLTYRGVLFSVDLDNVASPKYVDAGILWDAPREVPVYWQDRAVEIDLSKVPMHVLREAWGRTCDVSFRLPDEGAFPGDYPDVIDLKVIPTRKEQVARVLRLAAEMVPNEKRDWYQIVWSASMTSSAEVLTEAVEAFNSHLKRTGRIFGYGTRWNAFEGKSRPQDVDPDALRAEKVQALLEAADEVEKADG